MTIRIIESDPDFDKMYDLHIMHKKIGNRPFTPSAKEYFLKKVKFPTVVSFGYFDENDNLIAFVITRRLNAIPSWYFVMYVTLPKSKFNLKEKFLGEVLEAAVTHYENIDIYNFFWIQTVTHRSLVNGIEFQKNMNDEYRFKKYLAPGFVFEKVKANNRSIYPFIDELCQGLTYTTDILVMWTGNLEKNKDFALRN